MELLEALNKQPSTGWFSFNKKTGKLKFNINWEQNEGIETTLNPETGAAEKINAVYQVLIQCTETAPVINKLVSADGLTLLINCSTSGKNPDYIIGSITNADKIEQKIRALTLAKEKAEYSDYIKSAFLANMAHDIRVPLNSISGFSEMLIEDDFTPEEKREFAAIIERNTDNLVTIINDIIDVSKIEAGQFELVPSIFNPELELLDLFSKFQHELIRNKKSGVTLKLDFPKNKPAVHINTDKLRFRQVFEQLLDNAVKFTHIGTITYGYRYNRTNRVEFFVDDTGIGIPEEKQGEVLNMFKKDEQNYTKPFGSNGLGLHIARNISTLLGSDLTFESSVGKGTTFTFNLPVHNRKAKHAPLKTTQQTSFSITGKWSGKKILIVDDTREIYDYIRLSLRNSSLTCLYAPSGKAALKVIDTISDIDLILMDIQMPEMNGVTTLKHLTDKKNSIPVIALTAFALTGDREHFLSEGFSDYLSKPLKQTNLFKTLKTYL